MTQLSFLTVEIAGQLVALNVDAVQAVLPMDEIVAVPLAPPTVVGITTKRGHVLTVVDARAAITRRHLPATGQGVIIRVNGHRYALLVDAIDEVVSLDPNEIGPPPPGMKGVWTDLTTGMIRLDSVRRALVVRLEHFVEATEAHSAGLNHTITHRTIEAPPV